jgi:signal transduction histidine kinase
MPELEVLSVWGNPRQLEQALLNLTMNARDAMPKGGAIELSLRSAELVVELSVRDSGIGMPQDVQAQLFTPFFTTKGTRGTGLGLRVVKSAVEAHKGSVTVESAPGQGTTFRLHIPRWAEQAEAKPAPY